MNSFVVLAETSSPAFDPAILTLDNPVVRWWLVGSGAGLLVDAVLLSGWGRSAWRRAVRVPPPTWPLRETGMLSLLVITLSLAAGLCAWAASGAPADGARSQRRRPPATPEWRRGLRLPAEMPPPDRDMLRCLPTASRSGTDPPRGLSPRLRGHPQAESGGGSQGQWLTAPRTAFCTMSLCLRHTVWRRREGLRGWGSRIRG